jgi:hypothetical protein
MSWYRAPSWDLRPDITSDRGRGRCYFTADGQSVCLEIEHPCGTCDQILLPIEVEVEVTLRLTVSQSVSQYVLLSSPFRDLRPDITSCRNVAV